MTTTRSKPPADPQANLDKARAYIAKMPPALQGSGGSTALYNVCLALRKGFSLPQHDAFVLAIEWNHANASPPFNEREVLHKINDAANSTTVPDGYLLPETGRWGAATEDMEAALKAKRRAAWPVFHPLAPNDFETIAALRRVPGIALQGVASAGFLYTATVDGHRSFVIREGSFAQARRFDGEPFKRFDDSLIKAKNLPGSEGAFVGKRWLGTIENPILLVEGVFGLVEGLAAALAAKADTRGWTILAATSAGSKFSPEFAQSLAGRRIRIVPDNDRAGMEAAGKWTASLREVGASVDAFRLPDGIKDLGAMNMEEPAHMAVLEQIFSI